MPRMSLTDLDHHALTVTDERPDRNLYEFDLTLWGLLGGLVVNSPEQAKRQFDLTDEQIEAIAGAKQSQLQHLASGVVISFRLQTSEATILDILERDYSSVLSLAMRPDNEFDSAYWLLMKSLANNHDHVIAAAAFGVSKKLALRVSAATDNQLRNLANSTVTAFTLRFAPSLIPDLISAKLCPERTRSFFQKYQQSLSANESMRQ